jgi:hypothetical protein
MRYFLLLTSYVKVENPVRKTLITVSCDVTLGALRRLQLSDDYSPLKSQPFRCNIGLSSRNAVGVKLRGIVGYK